MPGNFTVFIVEDDEWYLKMLTYHVELNPENTAVGFLTGKELLKNLHKKPDLITLDYSLGDSNANELLDKIKSFDSEIPVAIISGQENVSTAVELLKKGAYDYIVKDEDTKDRLWNIIKHLKENSGLKKEIKQLKKEVSRKYDFSKSMVGDSAPMQQVFNLMQRAINTNITVSITGETGTGKEMVAKGIHYGSKRKNGPHVAVNMAAIPTELIESELFGHEKGAFTGATAKRIGKFEEADGGTIFLDEIGDLDLNMQTKLLRVLQEKEITRVGGNKSNPIDVRIIVATHKDLMEEMQNKNFREDLYYRLLGLPVKLPPLRDRGNDIVKLARLFVDDFSQENEIEPLAINSDAVKKLLSYDYPGNVRELKAVMDLAIVMTDGQEIRPEEVIFTPRQSNTTLLLEEKSLRVYTYHIIRFYLEKYNQNIVKVAEVLDVGKSTIYRMIKEMEAHEQSQ